MAIRESITFPNVLSAVRVIISPFAYISIQQKSLWFLFIVAVAALTDFLDGFWARRYGAQTFFGEILDPIADKVFVISSFAGMYAVGAIPTWFLFLTIVKDSFLAAGALIVLRRKIVESVSALFIGKVNMFFQIILCVVAFFYVFLDGQKASGVFYAPLNICVAITSVTTVMTWAVYSVRIFLTRP
ncbi:CDP-alcohol phosphatidyltransferase family protein [Candidatus Hydrogenosomobacter endosymbioticus]|uniref:CDP-diacylglycerol--glycerol-3-phosphate 3-phosphatidyltransferase n=1 Tax=Candidatus Hydrogenosomobacter endosymbioticus TaxID=2558174 RepID=A0ABM7V9Q1_9PROT|nr:CDP-alcohol phosphatidyltransferase family protein [Candidatus Hydrogenosomobacter endosymbioticus]BDB96516.1 CDP-alcohol phosphatidyltransferase [Candidatus Hydrogenosomobacter endosymbioticus]